MQTHPDTTYQFGRFEVNADLGELLRDGKRVRLQEQPFRLLVVLLEKAGEVVSREELRSRIWPEDTFVDFDGSLRVAIRKLREALGDDADSPRYIETVPKRGYRFLDAAVHRFICPVESLEVLSPSPISENPPAGGIAQPVSVLKAPATVKRSSWLIMVAIAALGLLGAAVWFLRRPLPLPRISDYAQITHDGQRKFLGGTDGARIYFTYWNTNSIGEVPITGGQIGRIPVALKDPWLEDVSPDGTSLLIGSVGGLWSTGVLGDSMRHITNGTAGSAGVGGRLATWSPDAKSVVYTDSTGDIYVLQTDGSNPHRLNASMGPSPNRLTFDLAWSPDGRKIRFTRDRRLWEMSSAGAEVHQLIPDWRTSTWKCCGRWTSNGKFFIFLSGFTGTGIANPDHQEIWAIDERRGILRRPSAEPFPVSTGPMWWGSPIPSRDGTKIFARGLIQRGELARWDGQSQRMRPYLGGISAEYVAFSNDGKSVAYTSYPDGILWKSNIDGSGPVQLTHSPVYPKSLRWSPDGTQIAFNDVLPQGQFAIYIISSQGGAPQRLLPEDNGAQTDPNWSPDGKEVLFGTVGAAYGRADFSSHVECRLLDVASRRVSVVPDSKGIWSARWSPDGKFILGLSGKFDVVLFNVRTQRWKKLVDGPAHFPAWSRRSQFIYFIDSSRNVSRVSIEGGRAERVIDLTGFPHTGWMGDWMTLDPSDAPLLLHNLGTEDVYALTFDRK